MNYKLDGYYEANGKLILEFQLLAYNLPDSSKLTGISCYSLRATSQKFVRTFILPSNASWARWYFESCLRRRPITVNIYHRRSRRHFQEFVS